MKRGTIRKTIIAKGKAVTIMVERRAIDPKPVAAPAPAAERILLPPLAQEVHDALKSSPRFPHSFWAPI